MVAAVAALPPRWVVIGIGTADDVVGPESVGTFAGFGVDLVVRLSPQATGQPARVAGLRADRRMGARTGSARCHAEVRVYAGHHDADAALAFGRRLRAEIDQLAEPIGVLVIADGANTLTPAAPGGYHPADVDVQLALDDALASGDLAALTRLPGQIVGRVAFGVLAGLAEPAPRSVKELYRAAPYGVGYFAGVWQP